MEKTLNEISFYFNNQRKRTKWNTVQKSGARLY